MAYITYNGKFLTRMSKWIGLDSHRPVPEPIPNGAIRWQFYDDTLQDWSSVDCQQKLRDMTHDYGYWAPVRDIDTGDYIPGMYDWVGDTVYRDFRYVFGYYSYGSGLNSLTYPCDLVDASLSSIGSNYWTGAFTGVTKLATATIKTSMGTNRSTCNQMFYDCDSVTSIYLHLPNWLTASDFNDPIASDRLVSLTLVSDATTMPIASTHWMDAPVLQELTLICTNSDCASIMESGNLLGVNTNTRTSIRKVTLAAPSPTAYIGGGYGDSSTSNNIFKNCVNLQSAKQYATYGSPDPSYWVEVPLKLVGLANEAFSNCSAHVTVDLSNVAKFNSGFAHASGFTSDDEILAYYKQLLRRFENGSIRSDNNGWFTGVTMSGATAACILVADGGTLNYARIANGIGLRFRFLDTTYVPSTSSTGDATSNNGTWTAVDQANGIWDWTGTTGSRDGESSAFAYSMFGFNYVGNLRHTINDCVLIACGTGYSPERTAHAFQNCTGLLDIIHPINLSQSAKEAFSGCTHLTDMPIVRNSDVHDCTRTFYGDATVQAHVKVTYDKLSASATSYNGCFTNCGPAEERAQIPTAWGGTMS